VREARPTSAQRPPTWPGTLVAAIALVAAAALCASAASGAGLGFLSDLDLRRPPLARLAPRLDRPAPALSRRILLVIIDGLGADRAGRLPNLDRLARTGTSGVAASHLPSLSRPNYVSIMTGVPPRHSGVRSNAYHWPLPLDSVLARARAAGLATALATDDATGFAAMFAGQLDQIIVAPWQGPGRRWFLRPLLRGDALVVVILSGVDDAGHHHGAASREYRRAALEVDAALGQLAGALDLARDTIIVTADHGHTDRGGHGGDEREVMRVPLVMAGAGVRRGTRLTGARLIDVAPTAAALLGLPGPGHALGRTLTEGLLVDRARAASLAGADSNRLARLRAFVAHASAGPRHRVLGLAALLTAAALLAGVRMLRLERRAALAAASGFPLAVIVLAIAVCRCEISLSALASHAEAKSRLLVACVGVIAVQVAVFMAVLRGRVTPVDRLASGCRTAAAGLCAAVAVVAAAELALALGGNALPPAGALLAIPLLRMSLAAYAMAVVVTLVSEIGLRAAAAAVATRLGSRPFAIR
jgi:hypothetical protein